MVQLLRQLASRHDSLLLWHLEKHKSALGLCISFIAGSGSVSTFDDPENMYTSDEEDYFSEDEEVIMVCCRPAAVALTLDKVVLHEAYQVMPLILLCRHHSAWLVFDIGVTHQQCPFYLKRL